MRAIGRFDIMQQVAGNLGVYGIELRDTCTPRYPVALTRVVETEVRRKLEKLFILIRVSDKWLVDQRLFQMCRFQTTSMV